MKLSIFAVVFCLCCGLAYAEKNGTEDSFEYQGIQLGMTVEQVREKETFKTDECLYVVEIQLQLCYVEPRYEDRIYTVFFEGRLVAMFVFFPPHEVESHDHVVKACEGLYGRNVKTELVDMEDGLFRLTYFVRGDTIMSIGSKPLGGKDNNYRTILLDKPRYMALERLKARVAREQLERDPNWTSVWWKKPWKGLALYELL